MTLSFRMETHWCHDFPKLAKESGFYFTTNRSKIQVDWNKLGMFTVFIHLIKSITYSKESIPLIALYIKFKKICLSLACISLLFLLWNFRNINIM